MSAVWKHLVELGSRVLRAAQAPKLFSVSAVVPIDVRTFASQTAHCQDMLIFRQLFDSTSYTYTYLLADNESKDAVIIDPVIDLVERDLRVVRELDLTLRYALNTHVHSDHITGTGLLKQIVPTCYGVISAAGEAKGNIHVKDGDVVKFGKFDLEVRVTPGHTNGCLTFVLHACGLAFTGDALLIRGCGRTDYREGNAETLLRSVHGKIFSLPDNFLIYPGHDYTGQTVTTVAEEKTFNRQFNKDLRGFVEITKNAKLSQPKQIFKELSGDQ